MKNIKPVKQKTVVSQVMEQLREMIASGTLKPNDKVPNEYELAERFGIGRSTIREALKIFQYLGIIELRNPKGTFVCESSNVSQEALSWSMLLCKKDLKNILELRLIMEHQGLWYLMVYYRDEPLISEITSKLKEEVENIKLALESGNEDKRIEADYNFHKHIIEACENDLFNNLYETMKSFSYKEIELADNRLMDKKVVVENHNKLIDVINEGDLYKAMELFRRHIRNNAPLFTDP